MPSCSQRSGGAARVLASDLSAEAVACATANGVEAYRGDLFAPFPPVVVDLIVGVLPYVPTPDLPLLQRDTFTFEPELFYDGGTDGLGILRRAIAEAPRLAAPRRSPAPRARRPPGRSPRAPGFTDIRPLLDEEGDIRGIEATLDS